MIKNAQGILSTEVPAGNLLWVDAVNGIDALAARGRMTIPFKTLTAAKNAATAGDTIMVLPETYNEKNLLKNGVKSMNEAVNEVRKEEPRRWQGQGDDTLKNTRQLGLYGLEKVPARQAQWFAEVKALNLKTSRAWALKEVFRGFWWCDKVKSAERYFGKWYGWAMRSRLAPVKKVARMCRVHLANILTFFVHRRTNGPIEGLNNKIQGLIKKAYGYRNKKRFEADLFFHWGGLDLYPAQ